MTKVTQPILNARVTPPRRRSRHFYDEFMDILGDRRTSHFLSRECPLHRDKSSVPGQNRIGRDDASNRSQHLPAERLSFDCQSAPLVIGKLQLPSPYLPFQNFIFRSEVLNNRLLLPVEPASENYKEEVGRHSKEHLL